MSREVRRYFPHVVAVILLALALAGTTHFHSSGADAAQSQSTEERLAALELRVTVLEATLEALTEERDTTSAQSSLHTLTGDYIERPEVWAGQLCTNFYPAGTTVYLSDWDGEVLGTGKLGEGRVIEDSLCAQSFEIGNVPERGGYVVNVERRAIGSAYEFTLADVQESNWHIEVRSRYRP